MIRTQLFLYLSLGVFGSLISCTSYSVQYALNYTESYVSLLEDDSWVGDDSTELDYLSDEHYIFSSASVSRTEGDIIWFSNGGGWDGPYRLWKASNDSVYLLGNIRMSVPDTINRYWIDTLAPHNVRWAERDGSNIQSKLSDVHWGLSAGIVPDLNIELPAVDSVPLYRSNKFLDNRTLYLGWQDSSLTLYFNGEYIPWVSDSLRTNLFSFISYFWEEQYEKDLGVSMIVDQSIPAKEVLEVYSLFSLVYSIPKPIQIAVATDATQNNFAFRLPYMLLNTENLFTNYWQEYTDQKAPWNIPFGFKEEILDSMPYPLIGYQSLGWELQGQPITAHQLRDSLQTMITTANSVYAPYGKVIVVAYLDANLSFGEYVEALALLRSASWHAYQADHGKPFPLPRVFSSREHPDEPFPDEYNLRIILCTQLADYENLTKRLE